LNNDTIEVKFKQIHIDNAKIIDSKNVKIKKKIFKKIIFVFFCKIISSDEKESIMKLLKDVIQQTTIQCCFYLSDNQEKTVS
jgi:hypothetical protein